MLETVGSSQQPRRGEGATAQSETLGQWDRNTQQGSLGTVPSLHKEKRRQL